MRTKIYINDEQADVTDDIDILLNLSVADIRNPEARNSEFTKTVTLPGTKNNNKILGHIFDVSLAIQSTTVNFLPDFNPNLKASCRIYDSDILQVDGYMQLLQINLLGENHIEYEVAIFGSVGNLFGEIGQQKLSDLDLGRYDHDLTTTNVSNSWATSIKDSTAGGGVRAFTLGVGYVYPFIDYGLDENPNIRQLSNFKPAIYAKTIVDFIFSQAGYSYASGGFFDTTLFKSLIVPYTGTAFGLSDSDVNLRHIQIYDANVPSTLATVMGTTHKTPTIGYDNYTQYNTGTGVFTFSEAGIYAFEIGAAYVDDNAPTQLDTVIYTLYKNGNQIAQMTIYPQAEIYNKPIELVKEIVNVGDTYELKLTSGYNAATNTTYTATYWVKANVNINIVSSKYLEGVSVDMNTILPKEILQRDFLMGLVKCFNLVIEPTAIDKQVRVETMQDYRKSVVHDWSRKIDLNSKVEIIPMGALDANPYYFTFKPDTDYLNKLYSDEYTRTYGDLKNYIANDFITNEKKIDTIFSPSPLFRNGATNTQVIETSVVTYGSDGKLLNKGGNIRLLYYGGLKGDGTQDFSIVEIDGSSVAYTTYPYAGSIDDPLTPTFDLNFATPQKVYYTDTDGSLLAYPSNNLFTDYWEEYIDEITNKDSKIVRAYFRLTAADIYNLTFADLYYFMGQYFRLNSVKDHVIGKESLTLCEFIKTTPPQG